MRRSIIFPEKNEETEDTFLQFHHPPSPQSGAEHFFLPTLSTSNISAYAFAQSIRDSENRNPSKASFLSYDDYQSCASSVGESVTLEDHFLSPRESTEGPHIKQPVDIKVDQVSTTDESLCIRNSDRTEEATPEISQEHLTIEEPEVQADEVIERETDSKVSLLEDLQEIEDESEVTKETNMSTQPVTTKIEELRTAGVPVKDETTKSHVKSVVVEETTSTAEPNTKDTTQVIPEEKNEDETNHFDVSQHVYDGVKNVWGFGCSIGIVRPFFKVTENVAGKVLNITTGIDLGNGDEEIKPKLAQLDDNLVNPVINKVVSAVMPLFVKEDKGPTPVVGDKTVETTEVKGDEVTAEKKNDEASAPEMTPIPIPIQ